MIHCKFFNNPEHVILWAWHLSHRGNGIFYGAPICNTCGRTGNSEGLYLWRNQKYFINKINNINYYYYISCCRYVETGFEQCYTNDWSLRDEYLHCSCYRIIFLLPSFFRNIYPCTCIHENIIYINRIEQQAQCL